MTTDSVVFQVLQNALQVSNLRQQVYANNIANADTPGYKRQDVSFESLLKSAMMEPLNASGSGAQGLNTTTVTPNFAAMAQIQPNIVTDTSTTVDNNGNNVDVDAEMSRLAENQIRYNALTQDIRTRLTRMQTAINGG